MNAFCGSARLGNTGRRKRTRSILLDLLVSCGENPRRSGQRKLVMPFRPSLSVLFLKLSFSCICDLLAVDNLPGEYADEIRSHGLQLILVQVQTRYLSRNSSDEGSSPRKMERTPTSTSAKPRQGHHYRRPSVKHSLSDAESCEDAGQDVFGGGFAGYLAEVAEGVVEADEDDLFAHFLVEVFDG